MTRIVNPGADLQALDQAVDVAARGGLIVFPTDTVYGVGASVDRPDAVGRLYIAKGRPLERAIPVLVSGHEAVDRLATQVDDLSRALMKRFWPGPLTVVVPAAGWLSDEIVRGTGGVGVRMPDHPVALALIEKSGGALATTSANRSGEPETRTAKDAFDAIGERVDLVVDGGETPGGVPSTVVRVIGPGEVEILRAGAIEPDTLRAFAATFADVS